jgi:hypothetical protein
MKVPSLAIVAAGIGRAGQGQLDLDQKKWERTGFYV